MAATLYPMTRDSIDVAVIGSGAAGLTAALAAAEAGAEVLLLDKSAIGRSGATIQANLAASAPRAAEWESHAADVVRAGRGEADPAVVGALSQNAERVFRRWLGWGVPFRTLADGDFERTAIDGAHSVPRAISTGYPMGEKATAALRRAVRAQPRITAASYAPALDLALRDGSVVGLLALDLQRSCFRAVSCGAVVLATGGAQALYHASTTSDHLSGDGWALARRAGARLAGLEFVLFHPVGMVRPLPIGISKTVLAPLRFVAGTFRNARGDTFAERYHPAGRAAPWAILSYAIADQVRQGLGTPRGTVLLEFDEADRRRLEERFPDVLRHLEAADVDIFAAPVEVTPMAHFFCGGVAIDPRGRTSVPGLYAAGEAAAGAHGATRLGADALTAAAVFGELAGSDAAGGARPAPLGDGTAAALAAGVVRRATRHAVEPLRVRERIRDLMTEAVGPFRDARGLEAAIRDLRSIAAAAPGAVPATWAADPFALLAAHETANEAEVGCAIAEAALARRESRGTHHRVDYPAELPGREGDA